MLAERTPHGSRLASAGRRLGARLGGRRRREPLAAVALAGPGRQRRALVLRRGLGAGRRRPQGVKRCGQRRAERGGGYGGGRGWPRARLRALRGVQQAQRARLHNHNKYR